MFVITENIMERPVFIRHSAEEEAAALKMK
jgi:hypothetical protein